MSMHYCADVKLAFSFVSHILRDLNYGFLLKYIHANRASLFFICVYIDIGRGLYYGGFTQQLVRNIRVITYILMIATAFTGYVLPWAQMSFCAATVITNPVSAISYIGNEIVQ